MQRDQDRPDTNKAPPKPNQDLPNDDNKGHGNDPGNFDPDNPGGGPKPKPEPKGGRTDEDRGDDQGTR